MSPRLEHRIALASRLSGSLKDSKSRNNVGSECKKAKSLLERGHNESYVESYMWVSQFHRLEEFTPQPYLRSTHLSTVQPYRAYT